MFTNKVFGGILFSASFAFSSASMGSVVGVGYGYRSSVQSYVCEHPNVIREVTTHARQDAWDDALHNCKELWWETNEREDVVQECSRTMSGEYSLKVTVRGEFACSVY